jgi:uncharacterized protein YbjT (DUF2867 family)
VTKILILGAHGQIARVATRLLLERTDAELTLYLRKSKRLSALEGNDRVRLIEGDVLDIAVLDAAMAGQEVVYANLSGDMEKQARAIVAAMNRAVVRRLIFISSMGIYDEVPGERHGAILDPYRRSAAAIESSDLDYTIIRPVWLSDDDDIAYGTTLKGETFANAGATVSRKSVADLIVKLVTNPVFGLRQSFGVHAALSCGSREARIIQTYERQQ